MDINDPSHPLNPLNPMSPLSPSCPWGIYQQQNSAGGGGGDVPAWVAWTIFGIVGGCMLLLFGVIFLERD